MNQQYNGQHPPRKPGEVKVETPPGKSGQNGSQDLGGEYVDFKEIKE
jgi:hypothetical protein